MVPVEVAVLADIVVLAVQVEKVTVQPVALVQVAEVEADIGVSMALLAVVVLAYTDKVRTDVVVWLIMYVLKTLEVVVDLAVLMVTLMALLVLLKQQVLAPGHCLVVVQAA